MTLVLCELPLVSSNTTFTVWPGLSPDRTVRDLVLGRLLLDVLTPAKAMIVSPAASLRHSAAGDPSPKTSVISDA